MITQIIETIIYSIITICLLTILIGFTIPIAKEAINAIEEEIEKRR